MPLTACAAFLSLAEKDTVRQTLTRYGLASGLVQRFIAGETLSEALKVAQNLHAKGIGAALDLLGENTRDEREAEVATQAYLRVLDALALSSHLTPYLSVKLTALGLDLGETVAARNLDCLLIAALAVRGAFICVDMEGSAYTQRTLDIVRSAHTEFGNVGIVLQSYLRRTDDDLKTLLAAGISIRLVKGAYAEPPTVAYPDKCDVDQAYLRQMRELLRFGQKSAIATHDRVMLREAKKFIREEHLPNDNFEFQMLLGIRRDLQESLAAEGYHVRAYIPFGVAWYPYFVRRLAERPANLAFVLRNLLK